MKKILFLSLALFSMGASAQVKVETDGSVKLAASSTADKKVQIGSSTYISGMVSKIGLQVGQANYSSSPSSNVGIAAEARAGSSSVGSSTAGVIGLGVGGHSGNVYGLVGVFAPYYTNSSTNGAAIYGTIKQTGEVLTVDGQYAAYFDGPTNIVGNVTATQYLNQSDIRLKENVSVLCDVSKGESALDNLMDLNVLKYNYKKRKNDYISLFGMSQTAEKESAMVEDDAESKVEKLHFGISAQELQTVYPNLVEEGQDGYLAVNYVELVPVLIQAIQEMQQEIDELRGGTGDVMMAKQATGIGNATANAANRLYQNNPNPFKESTQIRFTLADDATDAAVCIFDMTGKQLKRIPVAPGMESVTLQGSELNAGMYLYSLIVNGQEVDTKRMILSK